MGLDGKDEKDGWGVDLQTKQRRVEEYPYSSSLTVGEHKRKRSFYPATSAKKEGGKSWFLSCKITDGKGGKFATKKEP